MKLSIAALLCIICLAPRFCPAQSWPDCLPSGMVSYFTYDFPPVWNQEKRHWYGYDSAGFLTLDSTHIFNAGTGNWQPYRLYKYQRDAEGRKLAEEFHAYDTGSGTWKPDYLHTWKFDLNGNETEYHLLVWNFSASSWDSTVSFRTTYTYDANDSLLLKFQEQKVHSTGSYEDYQRHIWTRDASGRALTLVYESGPPLTNHLRYEWTYPGAGGFDSEVYQYWNGSAWVNYTKQTDVTWNNFIKGQKNYSKLQNWNAGFWIDSLKTEWVWNTHDGYLRLLFKTSWAGWDTLLRETVVNDTLGQLHFSFLETFAPMDTFNADSVSRILNPDQCPAELFFYEWKWDGAPRFGPYSRYVYTYGTVDVPEAPERKFTTIYPNPSSDYFSLEWEGGTADFSLYDIYGNKLLEISSSSEKMMVDMSNYPPGVYLLHRSGTTGATRILHVK